MEINALRRGSRVPGARTPEPKKEGRGLSPGLSARADKLALSRQAVTYLEQRNQQLLEEARMREEDAGDGSKGKLDLLEKGLKALNKCQKIYARVVNGDKVPPEDLRYLEKNDPEGYKLALALRRPNRRPKQWESELDDEDRAELQNGGDSGAAAQKNNDRQAI